ncbi:MAG: phosphatase PAP2 family protein [Alphaproteobacteria bacterium]|nr:phosphatase PAP2 family protein [Alphaproteobacteria bacterium]
MSLLYGAGAALVFIAYAWVDVPVARNFRFNLGAFENAAHGLGSAVLVTGELIVVVMLAIVRLFRGHLSDFNRSVVVAALTSVCAYAANDTVFKLFFGVPSPHQFLLEGAGHAFHLLEGTRDSSFPSGHMTLAVSFCVVMMQLQRSTAWVLLPLLTIAAAALIVGDWHFVSDVLAGALFGWLAGFLAAELYRAHYSHHP